MMIGQACASAVQEVVKLSSAVQTVALPLLTVTPLSAVMLTVKLHRENKQLSMAIAALAVAATAPVPPALAPVWANLSTWALVSTRPVSTLLGLSPTVR